MLYVFAFIFNGNYLSGRENLDFTKSEQKSGANSLIKYLRMRKSC
jgi:hypothetical protein